MSNSVFAREYWNRFAASLIFYIITLLFFNLLLFLFYLTGFFATFFFSENSFNEFFFTYFSNQSIWCGYMAGMAIGIVYYLFLATQNGSGNIGRSLTGKYIEAELIIPFILFVLGNVAGRNLFEFIARN